MTYRERREAKAEKLQVWAGKRQAKADAGWDQAHRMADVIPFGQPILVGHHSEKRDRNYRNRIAGTYDRAAADAAKARDMSGRASGIEAQLAASIYDDDPDAIERLEERVAVLEGRREQFKAENAAYRKAHRAELAAMTAYERSQAVPHPAYEIQNLGGNITRNRDRLAGLRKRVDRSARSSAAGGVLVEDLSGGYVSVTFAEKPERAVLDALKAAGFRWGKGSWVGSGDRLPACVEPTDEPRQLCERCGAGPFFLVPAREFPTLCLDCSGDASRAEHGWTPENSLS